MDATKRFSVFKEYVEQKKIGIDLDRRKSIEYYNQHIATGKIKPSQGLMILRHLSGMAGYGLLVGLFVCFFIKWSYGLIICLASVFVRYLVWKILKDQALKFTKQRALESEGNLKALYTDHVISLKNLQTGKITRHPEKWTECLRSLV